MNRVKAWGLALAAAGAGGPAAAADPPAADAKPSLAGRLFGPSKEKPAEPKPEPKPAPPPRVPVIIAPLAPDVLAEAVKAEEQACTRRLDVLAGLRRVAAEKNDDKLLTQIDDLERQAVEVCQARVARMGVRSAGRRPSAAAKLDADLGAGAAVNPLAVAPPEPAGGTRPATAEARGGRP